MKKLLRRWGWYGLTLYERDCAMHGALEVHTPWGWFVFRPPLVRSFGRRWPWYAYLSPDATPISRRWGVGPGLLGYGAGDA